MNLPRPPATAGEPGPRPWPADGDRLGGRYRLLERLRLGGMSVVWRAYDEALHRTVAVKVPSTPDVALGVPGESSGTARLTHPDAVSVYDSGRATAADGRSVGYVVMQMVDGEVLADVLADGPLTWSDATRVGGRVARVLVAAHAEGIVHHDITPDNVLLTRDGVKVLDFGIAARAGEREGGSGPLLGTPPYVAPERLTGSPVQPASDVYSLGALVFEMLTGRPPYPETTWTELEAACRPVQPPVPPGVPGPLALLCQRCLSSDPTARPTAAEVAGVLESMVDGGVTARPRPRPQPVVARARGGSPVVAITLGLALIASIIAMAARPLTARVAAPGPQGTQATVAAGQPRSAATSTLARSTGTPTVSAAIVPPPTVTPSPPTTPPATDGTPGHRAGAGPPLALTPSVAAATDATLAAIDRNAEQGRITPNAALDLHAGVRNLLANAAGDPAGLDREVATLQRHLVDGARDGQLAPSAAAEVDVALRRLADAIRAALTR